jgi:ribosomal-protein-serine acetyltransferase
MFLFPLDDNTGLGPLEPWHAEQLAAAVDGARVHLAPWIPVPHVVTDVDSARDVLRRWADHHAQDTRHIYGIWRRNGFWWDSELVGSAVFPAFDTSTGMCELGAWLVPEVQGRGLITRAAHYLIDWAIRERGMSRVEWNCDQRNTRSRAVAQRLGLVLEGVRRSSHVVAGERQDCEMWSVLAPEWLARERPGPDENAAPITANAGAVG